MKISRKQFAILSALSLFIILVAALFIWQRNQANTTGSSLIPKDTITISGTRAISPCQALPEESVQEIYGTFGPKSYIEETYYSRSVDDKEVTNLRSAFPNTVTCNYMVDDEANSTVRVRFEQFPSDKIALRDWNEAGAYNKVRATELLNKFEAGIPSAAEYKLDPEKLQAASDALRKAIDSSSSDLNTQEIDNTSGAILYAPNRNGFISLMGNRIVTVSYEFGSNNFFDEERQVSPAELSQVIDKIKSTFDTISVNSNDTNLSQAPSPTLRTTPAVSKVGDTKILDACEILTDSATTSALGSASLSPRVERKSIPKDLESDNKQGTPQSNSCLKRTVSVDETVGYVSLELRYAQTDKQAADYFKSSTSGGSTSNATTDLSSNATQAKLIDFTRGSVLVQFARFQYGSYVGTLTISKSSSNDEPLKVDTPTYQTAVNAVIDKIKES